MFQAMQFGGNCLKLLDQRLLPNHEKWISCHNLEDVAIAIEEMVVRGAPAIGCAAAYGLALAVSQATSHTSLWADYSSQWPKLCRRMASTRPTAVNLYDAIRYMDQVAEGLTEQKSTAKVAEILLAKAQVYFENDLRTCTNIGEHGADYIVSNIGDRKKISVLTHCNTGSLATAGYGTALGVIRSLHKRGLIENVYVDETRPYLQGSRLTAFELSKDGIPFVVNVDGAAGYLMCQGKIDCVVVGADRIAINGDSANKIGTYSAAVNAAHHDIPFYVAAPMSTVDMTIKSGDEIPIEQRDAVEVSHFRSERIAPEGARIYNPSFDVTPGKLISAIITECGITRGHDFFESSTRASSGNA
jgi:methylthioribose-1-phosphate isomerase